MPAPTQNPTWPKAMATVTSCTYESGIGQALAFGLPTTQHFLITFNYWASNPDGKPELHTGTFTSAKPIPQSTLFPLHYDPTAPHQHTHDHATPINPRLTLIAIGILGSIILSAAWLVLLRSCH